MLRNTSLFNIICTKNHKISDMTLEMEVLDSLEDLKYPDFDAIQNNVSLLTDLSAFSSMISWISNQLQKTEGLESTVNPIKGLFSIYFQ